MAKVLRIVFIVLLAVSALLTLLFYAGGEDINGQPVYTDLFLIWAAILTGLSVTFTIILPIIQMIINPQNAKKGLFGILVLAVILGIAYVMSSGELLGITNPDLVQYDVPSVLKYAGTMIISIYLLAGIAVFAMIYTEVAKIFK